MSQLLRLRGWMRNSRKAATGGKMSVEAFGVTSSTKLIDY